MIGAFIMKKTLFALGLLLSLAACRSFEEAPIIESPEDVSSLSSVDGNVFVTATIEADTTKTSLGADGYKVNWSTGDKITVLYSYKYSTYKQNGDKTGDDTGYKQVQLTLKSGAGTPVGTFDGASISAKNLRDVTPVFAFYPSNSNVTISENKLVFSNLSFPNTIVQTGSTPNISKGNVKATASFVSNTKSIDTKGSPPADTEENLSLSCSFKELGTLLDFKITPTSGLVGDVLQRISFTAANTKIAGAYELSYDSNTKAVSITGTSTSDADKTVTITFDGTKPVFKQNTATEVLMTVLPYVKVDESVIINVVTDKHEITVNGKAAKAYQPGTKYSMTIDLNTVSDNIIIVKADTFSQIKDKLGKFTCDAEGNWTSVLSDENPAVQYGYVGNVCRLQNWDEGTITFLTFSADAVFSIGRKLSLKEKTLTTAEQSVEVEVVWKDGNKYWLETSDHKTGYILMKEE